MELLTLLLPALSGLIDKFVPDPQKRLEMQAEMTKMALDSQAQLASASRDVIVAEAASPSKLARSWRPVLMYLLMLLLVWIIAIAPVMGLVQETKDSLSAVPSDLWNLLMIGMGGYIAGRSGEKIAHVLAGGRNGSA